MQGRCVYCGEPLTLGNLCANECSRYDYETFKIAVNLHEDRVEEFKEELSNLLQRYGKEEDDYELDSDLFDY